MGTIFIFELTVRETGPRLCFFLQKLQRFKNTVYIINLNTLSDRSTMLGIDGRRPQRKDRNGSNAASPVHVCASQLSHIQIQQRTLPRTMSCATTCISTCYLSASNRYAIHWLVLQKAGTISKLWSINEIA